MARLILLVIAVLVAGAPGSVLAQDGMPPALVKVAEARTQALAPTTWVPGTVSSRNDAQLAAEVEGRLMSVADVGATVAQGDEIARIEDTNLRLHREELEAEIARAEARLKFLESEEKRFRQLTAANLASATQLEQISADRDVARGDLRVAQSRLAQNADQLSRTIIRAPFDGVVVERLATRGERVSKGMVVVRLVDHSTLEVVARAPLDYYRFVKPGQALELRSGQQTAFADIRAVIAVGGETTHQFELRLDIEPSLFPVGQTLRVAIPMAEVRDVLAVPRDALVLRPEGITVFVIDANEKAQQVSVVTGIGTDDQIEVKGALSSGDRVVIRGNERLQAGQPVTIASG